LNSTARNEFFQPVCVAGGITLCATKSKEWSAFGVVHVEERSVRGAAERVCRTQPAVRIALRKLEKEFSAPLFDRSKRYQYRLTHVGQVLYEYAFHILALRNEALSVFAGRRR
jgi:DNA-binding transcriptional LysR family regulator